MILNQIETHPSKTGKSISLKLAELGLNQGVVLGVTQYNTLREQDDQFNPGKKTYSNSFKYQKSGSNVTGFVWINLKENPAKDYIKLNLQDGEFFRLSKVKPDGYKFHYYKIERCDSEGNVQATLPVEGSGVVKEPVKSEPGPTSIEKSIITTIRDLELKNNLVSIKEDWVEAFMSKCNCGMERAVFLEAKFRDADFGL